MKNISLEKSVRLVLKIGSSLLIKNNKFNKDWLETLIEDLIFLKKKKNRNNCCGFWIGFAW